jgi:hypothetical protein
LCALLRQDVNASGVRYPSVGSGTCCAIKLIFEAIMKNQYFGDINDFRKYGLLRFVAQHLRIGVCWMLTPPDKTRDGGKIGYLSDPEQPLRGLDPVLFNKLRGIIIDQNGRDVTAARMHRIIAGATYLESELIRDEDQRSLYFRAAGDRFANCDIVFFDPDNGMEVPSVPRRQSGSQKYVFYDEIQEMYGSRKSVIVYQHFPRVKREVYLQQRSRALRDQVDPCRIIVLSTSFVAFFVLLQKKHGFLADDLRVFQEKWRSEFVLSRQ